MPETISKSHMGRTGRIALVLFCLVSVGASTRQMVWYFSHGPAYSDFRIFMTGIEMVRTGEGHNLYSFDAQQRIQTQLYPETRLSQLLPFNHLAYELIYYWPLSYFSFRSAILAWGLINLGIVFLIAWLLAPYTQSLSERTGIPIALLLFAFYSVVFTIGQGQDSLLFLFLLVASLRAMDADRPFLAGFILALACFKLHLALAIAFFVFALKRKWRPLAGFAAGGALVSAISLAMVGPRILSDYPAMLRNQGMMVPWGFIPWFMPNLRGILQWGLAPWLDYGLIQPIILIASVVIAVLTSWVLLRAEERCSQSLIYSAAIATTALISYHAHMQDLSMAALPMLVLLDRFTSLQKEGSSGGESSAFGLTRPWTSAFFLALAGFYSFRIVAELFPSLLNHGCLLCIPLIALWVVTLRTLIAIGANTRPAVSSQILKANAASAR